MPKANAVVLTTIAAGSYKGAGKPRPLLVVGTIPVGALSNATTSARGVVLQSVQVADDATAVATDLPTVIALANALKTKLNALLAAQRTAGQIAP